MTFVKGTHIILAAAATFARDPSSQIVRASHVEEYGRGQQAPANAVVDFEGNDPEADYWPASVGLSPRPAYWSRNSPLKRALPGRQGLMIGLSDTNKRRVPQQRQMERYRWLASIAAVTRHV